jgi:Protein of unknown function (DUF1344)
MRRFTTLVVIAMAAATVFVAEARAQAPPTPEPPKSGQEKIVQGQVKTIHPAGTELTLVDGMRLVAPPGAMITPGAVTEGMRVIASYREQDGENVLTELAVEEPSASPRGKPRPNPTADPPSESPRPGAPPRN